MSETGFDRCRVFLFDMDGVITDSMPNHLEAWRRVFGSFGVSVSGADILRREGEKGIVTLRSLLARHGIELSPEDLAWALASKEGIFRSLPRPALFPGAEELLRRLRRQGRRLALVTGTSLREARGNLPEPLLRLFQAVVSGDQVSRGKPDPEPYLLALEKLGASPGDAVVIENAPYGIRSARAAGLRCIALTTSLPAPELPGADLVLNDLSELGRLLSPANPPHTAAGQRP